MNTALKNSLTLLASAIALLSAPAARAQLAFDVNLNTATLNAQDGANAPFYLDFQLNYGGSTQPTGTVTLSNFQFIGGGAIGTPTSSGTATGSLASSVSLSASSSSAFNEFYQQFASTTTGISFLATVSENGSTSTPTEFTSSVLDHSLGFPAELFTTAPDMASLITLGLSSSATTGSVGAFSSLTSANGNTPVTGVIAGISSVPEPSTTAAILGCAALMIAIGVRRSGKFPVIGARPAATTVR